MVSLTIDGAIAAQGSVAAVLGSEFTVAEDDFDESDDTDTTAVKTDDDKEKDGKLVIAEEIALGHVSRKSCKLASTRARTSALNVRMSIVMLWFKNLGNVFFWFIYLLTAIMSEVCDALQVWWLGYWASQYALRDRADVSIAL